MQTPDLPVRPLYPTTMFGKTVNSPTLKISLRNGGIIDLVGPVDISAGSVVISEVLWGQDWNLADASESQWVELYNTIGARLPISENSWFLHFYELDEPMPSPYTPGIIDRIGTLDRSRTPWLIFEKGSKWRREDTAAHLYGTSHLYNQASR